MTIQKLAESTLDSLQDNRQSLGEYVEGLIHEAKFLAKRVADEADDYTTEELTYWAQVGYEAQQCSTSSTDRAQDLEREIRAFLWAIDRGYYGNALKIGDSESAFVESLRKAVA